MAWSDRSLVGLFALVALWAGSVDCQDPIATTLYGRLRGKVIQTQRGRCDGFFGVPFAAPPIGNLRWAKPQPPTSWSGIREAKTNPPACIQGGVPVGAGGSGSTGGIPGGIPGGTGSIPGGGIPGGTGSLPGGLPPMGPESEDCLFLNIITPKSPNGVPFTRLPVMVFIHGGVFQLGKASDYSQDGACENLAQRGVVLVFIQYRLGLYGFLSTGDQAALGNYGIWDQVQALRWVKENAPAFGGDPNQVTIFGESAGGISVSFLTYTPVARDLFQRSITESGSAHFPEAELKDTSVATAKRLAQAANCQQTTSDAYLNCLRQLSTDQLQSIYKSLFPQQFFFNQFAIRVDGELFTQVQLQEIDNQKPAVIGVNSLEQPVAQTSDIPQAQANFIKLLNTEFGSDTTAETQALKQVAKFVYIDSKGDWNDNTFVTQQTAQMDSDIKFRLGPVKEAILKANSGRRVFVYVFDHYNDAYFPQGYPFKKGAWHTHELCYIFKLVDNSPVAKCPAYTGVHQWVASYMAEMWTNFAKSGNPSMRAMQWPNFRSIYNANALRIRANLSIEQQYYAEMSNFWNVLVPNLENTI